MENQGKFKKGHISHNLKNEVGNKYNKLTIVKREENTKHGIARWLCECECGNSKIVSGESLRKGKTKSCGCLSGGKVRRNDAVYRRAYQNIKIYSEKKNLPFNLTLNDLKKIVIGKCEYCGRKPYEKRYAYHKTRYSKGKKTDEFAIINGIDKIIPKLGYVKDNCVSCCKYCNRAKSDLSLKDFKELITLIYNNYVRT